MADFTLSDVAKMKRSDFSLNDVQNMAPASGWQSQLGDAASAFGHHSIKLLHGAANLVENTVAAGANLLPDNPVSRAITRTAASDNQATKQWEADYQRNTPDSAGAYTGAIAGEVAPFLFGGAAKGLQLAGDTAAKAAGYVLPKFAAGLGGRIASAGTQGAIVGAASPVTDEGNYWDQVASGATSGAAIGGALPVVGGIVKGAFGGVKNAVLPIVSPKSVVAPALSRMAPEDLSALIAPQQYVPGSMPTTAQVLATPNAVATEKAFANRSPAFKMALAQRSNANNDARIAALQDVAGSPKAIEDAIAARRAAAQPWTDPANGTLATGAPVDASPVIEQLIALQKSSLGVDPAVKKGAASILESLQSGIDNTGQGGNLIRPDLLDANRQNVRSFISQHASNGAVSSKQEAAFEPVRSAIVDSIEGANPGYRAYLADYAKNSSPINTMEVAGRILDNVAGDSRSANTSGVPQVTLNRFGSALKSSTNASKFEIDPAAQATLGGIQSDLQRASISDGLRSPGSDTAYNVESQGWLARQLYGSNFTGAPGAATVAGGALGGLGGWLTGGVFGAAGGATAGAAAVKKLGEYGQNRVNSVFSDAMTDPEFAQQLIAKYRAQQSQQPGLLTSQIPQLGGLLGP